MEGVAVWDKTVQVGSLRRVSEEGKARWEGVDTESGWVGGLVGGVAEEGETVLAGEKVLFVCEAVPVAYGW